MYEEKMAFRKHNQDTFVLYGIDNVEIAGGEKSEQGYVPVDIKFDTLNSEALQLIPFLRDYDHNITFIATGFSYISRVSAISIGFMWSKDDQHNGIYKTHISLLYDRDTREDTKMTRNF